MAYSDIAPKMAYRLDSPLRFDIQGAAFKADPVPTFAAMRAAGPIVPIRVAFLGRIWATTTHAATLAMVKDDDLFVQDGHKAGKSGVAGFQWWMPRSLKAVANSMLQKDEPDHRRLRKLVDGAFARRDVLAMRASIDRIADRLLDGFEGRDGVDLAQEFSRRLPLEVISDLLGLPHEDRDAFADTARRALSLTNTVSMILAMGSLGKMIDYVRGQVEAARRNPRPGLIGELVQAEEEGDKLDESELLSMVVLLLIAGFETTTHLISDSVWALEQNPDQKAWLMADPAGRMERAVEELARFASPVQSTKPRYVARDTEFFGQTLRRGELILALVAAANADPAEFDHPERLQLDRFPNPHLVFSSGIHFCLGQQLARVETQAALTRLYARFPNLALAAPDRVEWIERIGIRGPKTLPLTLNGASRRLAA
jgi:cytochrome P450